MADQPTGAFIRRRRENNFRLEKYYPNGEKATEWVCWMGKELNLSFQHMYNSSEKRVSGRNLPVDGYAKCSNGLEVVLQYLGCYYHLHLCSKVPNGRNGDKLSDLENQLTTYVNIQYLQKLGYKVFYIWECEFDHMKQTKPDVKHYCETLDFIIDKRYKISEETIKRDVMSGKIFGMVECDLTLPESLRNKPEHREFQMIIKHAQMSREDIGPNMKQFAEDNNLLPRPSKVLLCSFHVQRQLVATPLLKFYLEKGVQMPKIYQLIQYKPMPAFVEFGQMVMADRRRGDLQPSTKIIADSSKLIGKSLNL